MTDYSEKPAVWTGEIYQDAEGTRWRPYFRLKKDGSVREYSMRLCKGKNSTCEYNAKKGREYCKKHGGSNPAGRDNHFFKTGRYSKVFKGNMLERYEKYLNTGRNRENLEAMAVLQVMIDDDAAKLQDNALLWQEAKDSFKSLQEAMQRPSPEKATPEELKEFERQRINQIRISMNTLQMTLNNGGQDAEARIEIRKNADLQTKIKERDSRQRIAMRQTVAMEEVLILLGRTKDVIDRYVPKELRSEFEADFESMVKGKPGSNVLNFADRKTA